MKQIMRYLTVIMAVFSLAFSVMAFVTVCGDDLESVFDHPVTPGSDFSYESDGAYGIRITGSYGSDTTVVIPVWIDCKKVTEVPVAVFFEDDSVVSNLIVPSGVTIIGADFNFGEE